MHSLVENVIGFEQTKSFWLVLAAAAVKSLIETAFWWLTIL